VRDGDTESFAATVLDELSLGTDVNTLRLIVDVLSTTAIPASCWFHHDKATTPEPLHHQDAGHKRQLGARIVNLHYDETVWP